VTSVLHKNLRAVPPRVVGGAGVHLLGADGRHYLDSASGVAVSSLGHGHRRVIDAIKDQVERLAYAHSGAFRTDPAEELADLLVARSPGQHRVYFLSGGSEIMDLSLRTAYQFHVERGEPGRTLFVSRRQSYHGSTLGTLAVSGNAQRRTIFEPLLGDCTFVSPCYAYRGMLPGEDEPGYAARLAAELEATFLRLGPERVAAFVAETVVGSTSGAVPPVPGYFRAIREVCDRYGVLLVLDEVMAGMGRTGHLFACAEDGVEPDILAVGKGLAAGYQPLSAMLVTARVHAALEAGSGVVRNGQTFVNHAIACAAALAVQRTISDDGLLANVLARGEQLRSGLRARFAEHPHVGDVRGRGLFVGLELVADRATKQPLPPEADTAASLKAAALREGLLSYPTAGTIDGRYGDHVLFAPPFICTAEDVDRIVDLFAAAMAAQFPSVR
jgi:adenosylmethionine-8-amino-7-oxononanoate aminotransferase